MTNTSFKDFPDPSPFFATKKNLRVEQTRRRLEAGHLYRQGCRRSNIPNGFTLVEALVAMLITLMIVLAIHYLLVLGQKVYLTQEEWIAMDAQARVAMDTVAMAIRQAGANPTGKALRRNFAGSVPVLTANTNAIRILADLPQEHCNTDGDTFDLCDDGDNVWEDNENENGDGTLLPSTVAGVTGNSTADPDEDVTFLLTPCDASLVPTGSGPWTLVKRVRTAGQPVANFTDIPLSDNVINSDGTAGLEFRYILKIRANGSANFDTSTASFASRWAGTAGATIASSYGLTGSSTDPNSYTNLRLINRVLIRLTLRSAQRDRTTREYRYLTLQEDVDIRATKL